MKKSWWIGLGLAGLMAGVWYVNLLRAPGPEISPNQSSMAIESKGLAGIMVDFGDKQASYSATIFQDSTVLSLLMELSNEGHQIEIKHFDFGDLVEGIDGYKNGADKVWIYFVNGKSGEVGAGDKEVMGGDLVEWKYIRPIY